MGFTFFCLKAISFSKHFWVDISATKLAYIAHIFLYFELTEFGSTGSYNTLQGGEYMQQS